MKRSFTGLFGSGFAGLLCAAALTAAEPTPVLDLDFSKVSGGIVKDSAKSGVAINVGSAAENGVLTLKAGSSFTAQDQAAFKKWAKNVDMREISGSFWIRFDKKANAATASLGLLDCYIADDGTLRVALFSQKTEFLEDRLLLKSKLPVELGKWYHVEFSYSENSRRYTLYVDGKFQAENDKLVLPALRLGELKLGDGFCGAVRDIRFYEAALDSEELAIADANAAAYDALKIKLAEASKKASNGHVRAWAADLTKRIDAAKAAIGRTTIAAFKRLVNETGNLIALNDGMLAAPADTVSNQSVTVYDIPATTQDLYLPYTLPVSGKLTNKLNVFMAKDEYETASILVVPFRPIRNFTIRMNDLTDGKNVLKGSDVDLKLVKRWYRTGGAWASYHVDLRMRVLTPDMLLNDDKLILVDEFRRTNKMLFHYPTGDHYADVSHFNYDREWLHGLEAWFYDAPTLQPLEFREAGRNQQYLLTFHTAKDTVPGLYTGKLDLVADGRVEGSMTVNLRVLPFVLPEPKAYYDQAKPYFSHVNHHDGRENVLLNALKHNMHQLNGVASTPRRVQQAVRAGYPMTHIFQDIDFNMPQFGGPASKMTPEAIAQMEKILTNKVKRHEKMIASFTKNEDFTIYCCASSEASWYGAISVNQDWRSNILHGNTKVKLFAHSCTKDTPIFSPGIYDMDSNVKLVKDYADIWHAIGGHAITYAAPFPGPENPGLMRRVMGLELYKAVQYDGHMMHGYIGSNFNEFSKYPGGDGDYRTFAMSYTQKDDVINRVCIVGYREGFDDVRYATLMKSQALKYRDVKDQIIAREAKRQLAWLERVDGRNYDLDGFRADCAYRILALQNLVKEREGKGK